jgi:pimeloyl-ACP methyl ester carboxylesterase
MIHRLASRTCLLILAILVVPAFSSAGATNSDVAKETRWAEQVVDGLLDGEAIWLLDDSGHEFLGIYTEGDSKSGQAVILMHGIGVHPNWPDVIYPLRAGLLEQGISTLSLQMPILANDADPREYIPLYAEASGRIKAALEYLDDNGYRKVTLVGHSAGARMATIYMSGYASQAVSSLVIIGMSPGSIAAQSIAALETIKVPILDMYGSNDLEPVLSSVERRKQAGSVGANRIYEQVRVPGAGHFFQGQEDALLSHVVEWLQAH